jgi:hypothetical protein
MRLSGVVYVTCGDFHDGSEKGTASVQQRVDAVSGEKQNGCHPSSRRTPLILHPVTSSYFQKLN